MVSPEPGMVSPEPGMVSPEPHNFSMQFNNISDYINNYNVVYARSVSLVIGMSLPFQQSFG